MTLEGNALGEGVRRSAGRRRPDPLRRSGPCSAWGPGPLRLCLVLFSPRTSQAPSGCARNPKAEQPRRRARPGGKVSCQKTEANLVSSHQRCTSAAHQRAGPGLCFVLPDFLVTLEKHPYEKALPTRLGGSVAPCAALTLRQLTDTHSAALLCPWSILYVYVHLDVEVHDTPCKFNGTSARSPAPPE